MLDSFQQKILELDNETDEVGLQYVVALIRAEKRKEVAIERLFKALYEDTPFIDAAIEFIEAIRRVEKAQAPPRDQLYEKLKRIKAQSETSQSP